MMHDGRISSNHSRGADVVAGVDDGVLPDHAFGLAAAFFEGGGGGVDDGFLFVGHGCRRGCLGEVV